MPLTFAETPLYYKDSQGNYHRVLSGADMTGYRTAAAQDVIDAAQNADIASRAKADEIGIVITGARPSMVVSAGQYVIVRSSTITGVTDGLYKAINALSPSTDVTAADLMVVSYGGLNKLIEVETTTVTYSNGTTSDPAYKTIKKCGKICTFAALVDNVDLTTANQWITIGSFDKSFLNETQTTIGKFSLTTGPYLADVRLVIIGSSAFVQGRVGQSGVGTVGLRFAFTWIL